MERNHQLTSTGDQPTWPGAYSSPEGILEDSPQAPSKIGATNEPKENIANANDAVYTLSPGSAKRARRIVKIAQFLQLSVVLVLAMLLQPAINKLCVALSRILKVSSRHNGGKSPYTAGPEARILADGEQGHPPYDTDFEDTCAELFSAEDFSESSTSNGMSSPLQEMLGTQEAEEHRGLASDVLTEVQPLPEGIPEWPDHSVVALNDYIVTMDLLLPLFKESQENDGSFEMPPIVVPPEQLPSTGDGSKSQGETSSVKDILQSPGKATDGLNHITKNSEPSDDADVSVVTGTISTETAALPNPRKRLFRSVEDSESSFWKEWITGPKMAVPPSSIFMSATDFEEEGASLPESPRASTSTAALEFLAPDKDEAHSEERQTGTVAAETEGRDMHALSSNRGASRDPEVTTQGSSTSLGMLEREAAFEQRALEFLKASPTDIQEKMDALTRAALVHPLYVEPVVEPRVLEAVFNEECMFTSCSPEHLFRSLKSIQEIFASGHVDRDKGRSVSWKLMHVLRLLEPASEENETRTAKALSARLSRSILVCDTLWMYRRLCSNSIPDSLYWKAINGLEHSYVSLKLRHAHQRLRRTVALMVILIKQYRRDVRPNPVLLVLAKQMILFKTQRQGFQFDAYMNFLEEEDISVLRDLNIL